MKKKDPVYEMKHPETATHGLEDKLEKIVEETVARNMTLISGIPPWMQMYFDRLMEKTGKKR